MLCWFLCGGKTTCYLSQLSFKWSLSPLSFLLQHHCFHQVGTYSNGSSCKPCEIGHYCPSPLNTPQPCPQGTYANETRSVSCKACDAGYSCLDPANTPKACAAGEHSISGQSTCTVSGPCRAAKKYYCPVIRGSLWNSLDLSSIPCNDCLGLCIAIHP